MSPHDQKNPGAGRASKGVGVGNGAALGGGAIILIGAYLAAQMISDVASLKIGNLFGIAVDLGTFIYPLTFTLRDLVHRSFGKKAARTLIFTAAGVNLAMAAYLWFASVFPPDLTWPLQDAFAAVLSPAWTIVVASIAAELVSELVDTEVYHWFVTRVTRKHPWLRVLVSNGVSVPIDSLIFTAAAFAWSLPLATCVEIFLVNVVVKFAMTLTSLPLIYLARERTGQ